MQKNKCISTLESTLKDKKTPTISYFLFFYAVPLAIGLLFTVLAIIAAAFGVFYWYRRPSTPPTEEAVLVDEGEHETVRFSIGARWSIYIKEELLEEYNERLS